MSIPSARIIGLGLLPLNLPMRQPFVTACGEKRISHNLLVILKLDNGYMGYGEASESLAWPQETQAAMTKHLHSFTRYVLGERIAHFRRLIAEAWEIFPEHPTAIAALECALFDAVARTQGTSLWRLFGGKHRSVTTSLTISAWPASVAGRAAHSASLRGFHRFKVKVTGNDIDEDIRRVVAVCKAAPTVFLIVDANQGFSTREAIRFCLFLRQHRLPVRLIEQPVVRENREGLAQVQKEGRIPIAADESARTVSEIRVLIRKKTVSVINIKLAKCGLLGTLKILPLAKAAGVKLMIGCMAESAIGLTPSVHLACGTDAFSFVDLDSHLLVASPSAEVGFTTHADRLAIVASRLGSGIDLLGPALSKVEGPPL